MLGCFLYLKIILIISCKILSARGSVPLYPGILEFLIAFGGNYLKQSHFDLILSDSKVLTIFQNCLLSAIFFSFKLARYSFLVFCAIIFSADLFFKSSAIEYLWNLEQIATKAHLVFLESKLYAE